MDARLPILEANTIRVLSRLTAFRGEPGRTAGGQKHLWSIAEAILPAKRVGAFNQSLMELGSEICTPQVAGLRSLSGRLALRSARPEPRGRDSAPRQTHAVRRSVTEAAVVIRHRGRVLLDSASRASAGPGSGTFRGSRSARRALTMPACEIARAAQELVGLHIAGPRLLATLKHGVTRFRITLHCFEAKLKSAAAKRRSGPTCRLPPLAGDRGTDRLSTFRHRPENQPTARGQNYSAKAPSFGFSAAR